MCIDSFLRYLANEKRYSNHTVRSYKSDLEQFVAFGSSCIKDFDPLTCSHIGIRKWIIFLMEEGKSTRSVNRKITTLKSFYKFLFREQLIDDIPTQKVVVPKMTKKLPEFISQDKMNQLFDQFEFPDSYEGERDKLILLMFYCTGIRLTELVNIKLQDVDFYYNQVKVLGKRKKERLIPINKELRSYVIKFIESRRNLNCVHDFLFTTAKGKPAYDKLVYRVVNKYLGNITTLDKKSPHVLRHTFATQMLNNGADINAIKELLGHANLSATQIYTHTSFEKLKVIYNQAHPRA